MLFSSVEFIFCFLPTVLFLFQLFVRWNRIEAAKLWLIAASLVFYGNFIPVHIVLLATSTVINFLVGRALQARRSRLLLASGIAFNLIILATFKYADFIVQNINALADYQLPLPGIILPLALSFFTFQKIAYIVDVYRGGAPRYQFNDFVLFVAFFPQLIAGPIVHHTEILPQIREIGRRRVTALDLSVGATAFALGLFKKLGIADSLAIYSDAIFDAARHGTTPDFMMAWIGVLAFALQIYFDFSAYSDMALGLGRMFGIRLPVNFLSPYKSTNIIEFWRRWHITLSRFLRDYLYIPLGGNRVGRIRRFVNLWIVMLLGGLWHGANWTFVAWGALHALYLTANHAVRAMHIPLGDNRGSRFLGWTVTMAAVLVAWVFFRAPDFATALSMLEGMAGRNGLTLPLAAAPLGAAAPQLAALLHISFGGAGYLLIIEPINLLWFPVAVVIALAAPNVPTWLAKWDLALGFETRRPGMATWAPSLRWGVALGALLTISLVYQRNTVQFLYFQF
jgi:D-alanyl-lipoteichoic acid acyltransferase DltB (MBOAT superfamily)